MVGGFSRFLHPHRAHEDEQFAADGRDLSDTTHPDYDPATDPELREFHFRCCSAGTGAGWPTMGSGRSQEGQSRLLPRRAAARTVGGVARRERLLLSGTRLKGVQNTSGSSGSGSPALARGRVNCRETTFSPQRSTGAGRRSLLVRAGLFGSAAVALALREIAVRGSSPSDYERPDGRSWWSVCTLGLAPLTVLAWLLSVHSSIPAAASTRVGRDESCVRRRAVGR